MSPAPWLARRRVVDATVAVIVLVGCLPVVLLLAIAVRASSRGPALIRVSRIGRGGVQFGMWKLRSMHLRPGPGLAVAGDPRITRFGRLLRRTHLDELPQLLNVVRGDMSLVGPRPETPEYVDASDPRWAAVLGARPGLLGPTQLVVHRSEGGYLATAGDEGYRTHLLPVKLAIDAWYVRRASPRLDAAVVLGTVQELVMGRRASVCQWVKREVPEAVLLAGPPEDVPLWAS